MNAAAMTSAAPAVRQELIAHSRRGPGAIASWISNSAAGLGGTAG